MTMIDFKMSQIDWESILLTFGKKLGYCLMIYLIFLVVRKLVRRLSQLIGPKAPLFTAQDLARQQTLHKLFLSLSDYSLFFITLYAILAVLGVPVSSLLAGAGIAGLAIGLGAQGFLTDLINGAFILLERQYDVGDTVVIQGIRGKVTNLGIRTTQLKSQDGTLHFIPNRNITYVSNHSRGNRRVQIDLPLAFETDFTAVTNVLNQVCKEHAPRYPQILEEPTLLGARTVADGNSVYRVEIAVQNGAQETIYYTFYQLFQEALQATDQPA